MIHVYTEVLTEYSMASFSTLSQVTKIGGKRVCTEPKWRLFQMNLLLNFLLLLLLLMRYHSVFDVLHPAKVSPGAKCVSVANIVGINTDIFKHDSISIKYLINANLI